LRRIKREAEDAENLRQALEEERSAVAEKFASLDREAAKRERERQESFEQALQRAVAEMEKRVRELVSHIQDRVERLKVEREAQRQTAEARREAQRLAKSAKAPLSDVNPAEPRGVRILRDGQLVTRDQVESGSADDAPTNCVTIHSREISVGDKVRLRSFGSIGIVDQIKGDEAEVRVKSLRFREKLANLDLVEAQTPLKSEPGKLEQLRRARSTEVHLSAAEKNSQSEINVIGQTTDEAVDAVDKFLDVASLASLSQVRIVHGHGTGALRRAIADLLNGHPHVARFLTAPPDQGGAGATVVELRQ
jgi:DNA mismatch repair protein MutS2